MPTEDAQSKLQFWLEQVGGGGPVGCRGTKNGFHESFLWFPERVSDCLTKPRFQAVQIDADGDLDQNGHHSYAPDAGNVAEVTVQVSDQLLDVEPVEESVNPKAALDGQGSQVADRLDLAQFRRHSYHLWVWFVVHHMGIVFRDENLRRGKEFADAPSADWSSSPVTVTRDESAGELPEEVLERVVPGQSLHRFRVGDPADWTQPTSASGSRRIAKSLRELVNEKLVEKTVLEHK